MPKISICVPHWQVIEYIQPCLRSIRKHSFDEDVEVLVIDNGSQDASLDWLRSLSWIRLIERPEEQHTNWPENVFTAWDRGLVEARGDYFVTLHSDVFVKSDGWLKPLVRELERSPRIAASGTWKLEIENPVYALQKRVFGLLRAGLKKLAGKNPPVGLRQGHYPRDFCAMYRRDVLLEHGLTFRCLFGNRGGGYSIARQLWERGYAMGMVPVREMDQAIVHVAHGTAAIRDEKRLTSAHTQRKAETKAGELFDQLWMRSLIDDASLDNHLWLPTDFRVLIGGDTRVATKPVSAAFAGSTSGRLQPHGHQVEHDENPGHKGERLPEEACRTTDDDVGQFVPAGRVREADGERQRNQPPETVDVAGQQGGK